MVKSADARQSDGVSVARGVDRAPHRRVAIEAHVGAILVVVAGMVSDQPKQMALAEH